MAVVYCKSDLVDTNISARTERVQRVRFSIFFSQRVLRKSEIKTLRVGMKYESGARFYNTIFTH